MSEKIRTIDHTQAEIAEAQQLEPLTAEETLVLYAIRKAIDERLKGAGLTVATPGKYSFVDIELTVRVRELVIQQLEQVTKREPVIPNWLRVVALLSLEQPEVKRGGFRRKILNKLTKAIGDPKSALVEEEQNMAKLVADWKERQEMEMPTKDVRGSVRATPLGVSFMFGDIGGVQS